MTSATAKSPSEDDNPDFELVKELGEDIWIAVRKGEARREQFLAFPSPWENCISEGPAGFPTDRLYEEAKAFNQLLYDHNQAWTVRQVLNHENLISIVGVFEHAPLVRSQHSNPDSVESYLVWDFCDAANLSAVFRQHPREDTAFYLPESLCWHVLRSLTRAVAHLHDGKRLAVEGGVSGSEKQWVSTDLDWLPILHRDITPKNVFFQHPRGTETYGQCKLGHYEKMAVTGHAVGPRNSNRATSMSMATQKGYFPVAQALDAWTSQDPTKYSPEAKPYTLGDEMMSIGSVIFTMMTGSSLTYYCECGGTHVQRCEQRTCLLFKAASRDCKCLYGGCEHIKGDCTHTSQTAKPVQHDCEYEVLNPSVYLARARYTSYLRFMVTRLLEYDPERPRRLWDTVLSFAEDVEIKYAEWKANTKEGRAYVDLDDDMMARLVGSNARADSLIP